ncbi:aldehyde dehydrogenase family protein [Glaciecola siphonariae]|uniref:Aldehyde dehydrogenase n=1 Tax=Glaciecola siphonariae TaxID=521012 RepID=A0ABV9LZB5_9ALTE
MSLGDGLLNEDEGVSEKDLIHRNTAWSAQASADDAASLDYDYSGLRETLQRYFASRATKPLQWRQSQLQALLRMLTDNKDALSDALYKDLGKCKQEAYVTEIAFLQADIKHALKHIKSWMKPVRKSSPLVAMPAKSYIVPEPLGAVLIIGAWNYPIQLTLSPLIAAICAGNCAVIKPSELAEHSSAIMAKLLPEYLDKKAFAVVEGGKDQTSALLAEPFDKFFYTGGEQVGKIVMRAASEHLTPVTLELGGKSPCVVDSNIDFKIAANRIVWGKWMNVGQTCIAPDYVLIEQDAVDDFIAAMKQAIESQYSTEPKSSKEYGRIVNQRHCQRLASYLEGQDVIYGGQIDVQERYISPTMVLNPEASSKIMQEEIFGPLLPIIVMPTKQAIVEFINKRPHPLAAYLFTQDKDFEQVFVNNVTAGNMCINDCSMFMLNHNLPFGGVGTSGMGRYHGKFGFDTFSHEKTVMRRSFKLENAFRYAPFTKFKSFMLNRFIG